MKTGRDPEGLACYSWRRRARRSAATRLFTELMAQVVMLAEGFMLETILTTSMMVSMMLEGRLKLALAAWPHDGGNYLYKQH